MIYVAGGTVHTLGPGVVIVETQQQSDTTYRLYDYGRPRPLHLERGDLASIKERVVSGKEIRPAPVDIDGGKSRLFGMIAAPYFSVDLFELKEPHKFSTHDTLGKNSVQILVVVEGCGIVEVAGLSPRHACQGRCGGHSSGVRRIHSAPAMGGGISEGIRARSTCAGACHAAVKPPTTKTEGPRKRATPSVRFCSSGLSFSASR